ncbi:hypothetical protein D9611_007908 [Ephemerocybe angulata]|uniref:Reverse transcriptase domain-containing protein n=1 Tax=Ephemerocybe angulata TaxID=980116 RepID=A0A8H5CF58_9AGAR|nr:hypothetical protein D9611_007908 [Tulosesus angulatus]
MVVKPIRHRATTTVITPLQADGTAISTEPLSLSNPFSSTRDGVLPAVGPPPVDRPEVHRDSPTRDATPGPSTSLEVHADEGETGARRKRVRKRKRTPRRSRTPQSQQNNATSNSTNEPPAPSPNTSQEGRQTTPDPMTRQSRTQRSILEFITRTKRNAGTTDLTANPIIEKKKKKKKRRTRANVKIASLNIRGGGSDQTRQKWQHINQLMRQKDIGILAVQETHLKRETTESLNGQFERKMIIINSIDHFCPNSKGVAIVVNRDRVKCKYSDITAKELVAGRALLVAIPWKNHTAKLTILALYAPNDKVQNRAFWENINEMFSDPTQNLPRPDFILGDFNIAEEAIDRFPAELDNQDYPAIEALRDLKDTLRVTDGWRKTYPDKTRTFTWSHKPADMSQPLPDNLPKSRIDRIYVRSELFKKTSEWEVRYDHAIKTDHELVSARLIDTDAPYMGRGRWEIPNFLLEDDDFMDWVRKHGNKKLEEMEGLTERTASKNVQSIFKILKDDIRDVAKQIAREAIPKAKAEIEKKHDLMEEILKDPDTSDYEKSAKASKINEEIKVLETKYHDRTRENMHTKYALENETIGKVWIRANKENKPRDSIPYLKDSEGNLIKKSIDMANHASKYHDDLQKLGTPTPEEIPDTLNAKREALSALELKLDEGDKTNLSQLMSQDEIREALVSMPNGKASGPDGIPTELWKNLMRDYDEKTRLTDGEKEDEPLDVLRLLQLVYNDIESEGVDPESDFALGWMCPIFKKKERDNIANYRPITVLNADYKVFTKTLTIRLAPIALKIIHPNQAGFLKGRRIDDHTELMKLMIRWCESEEENGMLVLLDQEKAYDKITHAFLQETLETLDFPPHFRDTISALYKNAKTVVVINGEISDPYRVTRGVRQGDPLSCLLFNLAIESLACMLRKSSLEGIKIRENLDRLIATLFADDTTVYLSKEDKFTDLQKILDTWCKASGAKFNVEKSEIIPVGTEEFRTEFVTNPPDIPPNVHIVRDGEAVRALGAFIGNKIDDTGIWTTTLETVEAKVDYWVKSNPSQEGRAYITKLEPGGRTQYKSMVQSMTKDTEKRLSKYINKIMWGGKPSGVNHETSRQMFEHGGKKVLDIPTRTTAIEMMRSQTYTTDGPERKLWTYLADDLIAKDIPTTFGVTDRDAAINVYLQTWKTKRYSNQSSLPLSTKNMISAGLECGITFQPPVTTQEIKESLPIWFHPGRTEVNRTPNTGIAVSCLQRVHDVYTVGDLKNFVYGNPEHEEIDTPPPPESLTCECRICSAYRALDCEHPEGCRRKAKLILRSLAPKWNPTYDSTDLAAIRANFEDVKNRLHLTTEETLFDHRLDDYGSKSNGFRAFGANKHAPGEQGLKIRTIPVQNLETRSFVAINAVNEHEGDTNAAAAYGVVIITPNQRPIRISGRVPQGIAPTYTTAIACGLTEALELTGEETNLYIHLPSRPLLNALTIKLTEYENEDWVTHQNREQLRRLVALLRTRSGYTVLTETKTLREVQNGTAEAKELATATLNEDTPATVPQAPRRTIPDSSIVRGVRLAGMTQAKLYRLALAEKAKSYKPRKDTVTNLELTRQAAKTRLNRSPDDATIWKSLRSPHLNVKKIKAFMWKLMHNALPVGTKWKGKYADRQNCPACNVTELAEHIFTSCRANGQATIWGLAKETLERAGIKWETPKTLGDILSCAITGVTSTPEDNTGKQRLLTMTVAESAWLIWASRCGWIVGNEGKDEHKVSPIAARNKWISMMNGKLTFDILASSERQYKTKAIDSDLVRDTWNDLVSDKKEFTKSLKYHRNTGVLVSVGEANSRPPG